VNKDGPPGSMARGVTATGGRRVGDTVTARDAAEEPTSRVTGRRLRSSFDRRRCSVLRIGGYRGARRGDRGASVCRADTWTQTLANARDLLPARRGDVRGLRSVRRPGPCEADQRTHADGAADHDRRLKREEARRISPRCARSTATRAGPGRPPGPGADHPRELLADPPHRRGGDRVRGGDLQHRTDPGLLDFRSREQMIQEGGLNIARDHLDKKLETRESAPKWYRRRRCSACRQLARRLEKCLD